MCTIGETGGCGQDATAVDAGVALGFVADGTYTTATANLYFFQHDITHDTVVDCVEECMLQASDNA